MKHKRLITVLVIAVFVVFFLSPELQKRPVSSIIRPFVYIISTLQGGMMAIANGIGGIWSGYISLSDVHKENVKLREEIYQLQNENIQLLEAKAALEHVEALLEFKQQSRHPLIAARVIGRDPTNWYRTLIIDKGSEDGVEVDMGVIVAAGVVGRIMQSAPDISLVLLLTDRNSSIAGLIQQKRDEGIIEGSDCCDHSV